MKKVPSAAFSFEIDIYWLNSSVLRMATGLTVSFLSYLILQVYTSFQRSRIYSVVNAAG